MFRRGGHVSTFGGNPLGCAVARTALRVLIEDNLIERSAGLGTYFLRKLQEIKSPHVREIRGRGLWLAIELDEPARPYCEKLKDAGLLCKETHDAVIRIAPPLTITREEVEWAVVRIARVLAAKP